MKADPLAQIKLLDLQELDSRIAHLKHQLATLPQITQLETARAERAEVDNAARDARIARDDLSLAQRKADNDVEAVKARRVRDEARLNAGQGSAKDLEALQHELGALAKRISDLEDIELELMEELEGSTAEAGRLEAQVAEIDARIAELEESKASAEAEIRAEGSAAFAQRGPLVEDFPADLLALYDKLRDQYGVGAALLRARRCGGCGLDVDAAELSRIRTTPAAEVVRHEDCGRILIRTSESGL
ncbi:hypothetical protein Back2_26730 [Nocardioides baekrokdamisoli]|uniref:Uncharacterized protein n=1 Tax=Nocardioides baekrokdamisoli TaxID=1804624 RepID=A0A3G9IJC0_9ACTN|nr:C4-type zinc ribbon domain-containing protein [Nocardioides baekrokdamisoli]BBH18386.1 hypothetical protein Back2_26730 [Nocardioides baekrokdamisoli]